jgi:hypothetical protein
MGGDLFINTMARVVEYTEQSKRFVTLRISESDGSVLLSVMDGDAQQTTEIELGAEDISLLAQDLFAIHKRLSL